MFGYEALARAAVALLSQAMPDDWRLAEARTVLGEVLVARSDFSAAEPLLLDGWQQLDQQRQEIKPTERVPILRDAIRRLVRFYQQSEQSAEVQRWQRALDQLEIQAQATAETQLESTTSSTGGTP